MTATQLIQAWNKRLYEIYEQEQLTSIRGFGKEADHWKHNGIDLYDRYVQVIVRPQSPPLQFDPHDILDELISISDQILHFTAHTYLYGALINDPIADGHQPPGYQNPVYPNIQNLEAKRFDLYVDTVFEKIYGFWSRLANLLNQYLPTPLPSHAVDFTRVVSQLPIQLSNLQSSANYQWLVNYKDNEHKSFNAQRKVIVHHLTTGTTFKNRHLAAQTHADIQALMDERYAIPSFFKDEIYLTITGFQKVVDLIAEIKPPTTTP
jgi:hypothetical protein